MFKLRFFKGMHAFLIKVSAPHITAPRPPGAITLKSTWSGKKTSWNLEKFLLSLYFLAAVSIFKWNASLHLYNRVSSQKVKFLQSVCRGLLGRSQPPATNGKKGLFSVLMSAIPLPTRGCLVRPHVLANPRQTLRCFPNAIFRGLSDVFYPYFKTHKIDLAIQHASPTPTSLNKKNENPVPLPQEYILPTQCWTACACLLCLYFHRGDDFLYSTVFWHTRRNGAPHFRHLRWLQTQMARLFIICC